MRTRYQSRQDYRIKVLAPFAKPVSNIVHSMTPGVVATGYQASAGPAPYFTQKQPLPNWEVNCVPTSVAMILTSRQTLRLSLDTIQFFECLMPTN